MGAGQSRTAPAGVATRGNELGGPDTATQSLARATNVAGPRHPTGQLLPLAPEGVVEEATQSLTGRVDV